MIVRADTHRHYSNCCVDCSHIKCFSRSPDIFLHVKEWIYDLLYKISYVVVVVLCVNNRGMCVQSLALCNYNQLCFTMVRYIAVSTASIKYILLLILLWFK